MKNFSTHLAIFFLIGFLSFAAFAVEPTQKQATYTPDVDLSSAPASYRRRVIEFRNILRKEKTRPNQIKKAMELAGNRKSKYRLDAIGFLGEVRSIEALPVLITSAGDPDVREFALYALGEIRDSHALPTIIHALSDPGSNVRGNAERSFKKITGHNFGYAFNDLPLRRAAAVQRINEWWKANQAAFKVKEENLEEKKEAEEAWLKYANQYIHDLSR